jgi:hypothetical protein
MDRDLAVLVLNACYRASRELGEMGVLVHEQSPDADGLAVKHQAGFAIAEIGKITEAVFNLHPDLEAYVESRIERFGRLS